MDKYNILKVAFIIIVIILAIAGYFTKQFNFQQEKDNKITMEKYFKTMEVK